MMLTAPMQKMRVKMNIVDRLLIGQAVRVRNVCTCITTTTYARALVSLFVYVVVAYTLPCGRRRRRYVC